MVLKGLSLLQYCFQLNASFMCFKYVYNGSDQQRFSGKADGDLTCQQIHRLLWNMKFHYTIQNDPTLDAIQNQLNPVHILTIYSFKTNINTVIPSTPTSLKLSPPSRFLDYNSLLISHFHQVCYTSLFLTFPGLITVKALGEEYRFWRFFYPYP
jgi:hypothetical protein